MHYFLICSSGGLCQETSGRKMKRKCLRFVAFFFFLLCPNNSIVFYRVYQRFRLNIGKRNEMIIFKSLLTSFVVASVIFGEVSEIGLSLRPRSITKFSLFKSLTHVRSSVIKFSNSNSCEYQDPLWRTNNQK